MQITVASEIGYCYGVEGAINTAIKEAKKIAAKNLYSLGPIIHNNHTVKMLQDRYKIVVVNSIDEITQKGATVLIRSHGTSKKNLAKLKKLGFKIVDATCPFVLRTHKLVEKAQKAGYFLILLGKRNHPETRAIYESYPQKCRIVQTQEDLDKVPHTRKICAFFQSTVFFENYKWAIPPLVNKSDEFTLYKTICSVVVKRKKVVEELAKQNDGVIIIGGRNSSNTAELLNVAKKFTKTFQIESPQEIIHIDFSGVKRIGVATGTSTPAEFVKHALEILRKK
jgi:4-hydroxy-3-methylbut-2-enyl diphosphate reductase